MNIREKLVMDGNGLREHGAITIVVFGDSVTHGAFAKGELDYDAVYWNLLRKKINAVRSYVPVNVINSGIGGTTAKESVLRIETQLLRYHPDLAIVAFGLNDVNGPLEVYLESLRTIFTRCQEAGVEVIFMTQNMLNTYVSPEVERKTPQLLEYATLTARYQNEGKMDLYVESARALARELGVTVCDCYAVWKEMSKTRDTTALLANHINHPTREMHELFASELFRCIFPDLPVPTSQESTLYGGLQETGNA